MKFSVAVLALVGAASAFPAVLEQNARRQTSSGCSTSSACEAKYDVSNEQIGYDPNKPTPAQQLSAGRQNCGNLNPCSVFNAQEQYVSITGQHAYASPAAGDIRGPCPGLNAAANHGYLNRDGVQTLASTIEGLGAAFGMGADLSGFLAAYAIAFDGDLLTQTWSIGGPQQNNGVQIGGQAQGITWSHNKYEGDSSISRCDAYINGGDAHSLGIQRFTYAYEAGMDNDRYTLDKFSRAFAMNTIRSEAQNPRYFAPLFSTTLVSPAAYNFVVAMMSNHSSDAVGGYLDGEVFKTFFGVTGDYPNFKWQPGQEKIPENWYRRPSATPYQAGSGVFGDLISEFTAYPQTFRFGGNVNGVNTYQGINLSNFTGGSVTNDNILQGNNFACLVYQTIQQGSPDFISGGTGSLTGSLTQNLAFLNPYLNKAFGSFGCPQVSKFNDNNLYGDYPGHTYSPTGPATNC